jgi:hypothetical protein
VSGIVMNNVYALVFVRLGNRARPMHEGGPRQPTGKLRNVVIRDVIASRAHRTGCAIAGVPGHPIENLTMANS